MNRGLLWGISAALIALTRRADAYPDRTVHDRNWGLSAQWINFTVTARPGTQDRVQVQVVTQGSRCRDPLNRDLCNGSTAFIDLVGHVFSEATGRPVAGMTRCLASNRCPTDLMLPAGRYSIFLHGGPLSRGAHDLLVRVTRTTGGSNVPLAQDSAQVSDNIVLDVRDAPANFDLHSVLVSDGPTDIDEVSGAIRAEGNTVNDWIGVDATEAWLFDESFRALDADLSMSGVGPAALLRRANEVRGMPVRYVLVRPYRRPPFAVRRVDGSAIRSDNTEYPSVPGAGRMRVVLNDERDTDGDRLSDQVEFELGLCDGRSAVVRTPGMAFRCMLESEVQDVLSSWRRGMPLRVPSDPRDTDGDGLTDAAEVLGTDVVEAQMPNVSGGRPDVSAPYQRITNASQTLPLWGFDPRHKDMLLEIDRETMSSTSCSGVAAGCSADRDVYPSTNYTDVGVAFEALWSWRRSLAMLPALRVHNPDGRPGIEMHFDVRFAKVLTRAHGFMPQDVPTSTARGRFGEAGFIIHHPLGDTRSMCSCSDRFMSPDPRHGGMARYMLGRMGGGASDCNGELDAQVGIPDTVASHEFGHTQGLHHGGPMPYCFANPFARPEATDCTREDKVAFPSHMNYAFDYRISLQSNHDIVRGEVFSVGRNWPLPRWVPTATGTVLGWPELNSYGSGTRTNAADLWRPKVGAGGAPFYKSMSCGAGSVGMGCIDFNFTRSIEPEFVATGVVEPMQAISGAATFPQRVSQFVCDNGGALVGGGALCCPLGADRDSNDRCVTPARTVVSPVGGTVQTLFNMAMQAPFVGRPAAGRARRMYTLFQSDLGTTETSGQELARQWTRTGKIRWLALDKVEITTPGPGRLHEKLHSFRGLQWLIGCKNLSLHARSVRCVTAGSLHNFQDNRDFTGNVRRIDF